MASSPSKPKSLGEPRGLAFSFASARVRLGGVENVVMRGHDACVTTRDSGSVGMQAVCGASQVIQEASTGGTYQPGR